MSLVDTMHLEKCCEANAFSPCSGRGNVSWNGKCRWNKPSEHVSEIEQK